jgi:hypothetical protein
LIARNLELLWDTGPMQRLCRRLLQGALVEPVILLFAIGTTVAALALAALLAID